MYRKFLQGQRNIAKVKFNKTTHEQFRMTLSFFFSICIDLKRLIKDGFPAEIPICRTKSIDERMCARHNANIICARLNLR